MQPDKTRSTASTDDKLDQLILLEYPYPIAVNYRRLLDEQDWEKKTGACIRVFEYGLRAITLGLVSQYLICDVDKVSDPRLNQFLLTRLSRATLGIWNEIFFNALQAYEGKHDLFFMPELYDLYWDTSKSPHRPKKGIRTVFDRLVQMRNDLAHGVPPTDEASWQALFEASFRLLRQVLRHFTFLENYDLIRINWTEGEDYWYDIYTGFQITSSGQPLRTQEKLSEGWFYLFKPPNRFLELHPLLIFFEKELAQVEREWMRDAAIFDRFQRTSLDYLATVLGERVNLTDRTLIAEFIQIVYYNIEKVKMARREAKKLNWGLLKEVAQKISSERSGDVRSKYRREVYLQREEAKQSFEKFLASDETCLVLIGKSGVGKSNFFLSLMDEYEGSSEVCTLMYNGARFSAETYVAEALARDFDLYLKLEGLAEKGGVGDILFEINRIERITDRKVVLLIDAINENPNAKGLLRRIDALVEVNPYPWLKVVISARPETWRTIKRGVRLAEHKYYREAETGQLGVEMQPFSLEVEIKPFGREELPAVYAKYQEVFGLQTAYENVPVEVRQMLRDPLTLWLVAQIHRGDEIPPDIKVSELYQAYVYVLVSTERLHPEDIRFLERELVPLMIRKGIYANSITGEAISQASTTDGKSLFELIHSDEVLSNGRRVNQSYANLVDAEILMQLGTDVDYKIAFKYERFYDHFAGKQLFTLAGSKTEKEAFYRDLVTGLLNRPYLWGPIQNALLLELKESPDQHLIIALAQTSNRLMKDMLVAVLSEYSAYDPSLVRTILLTLLETKGRLARILERVSSILPGRRESVTEATLQHYIAVEAAYGAHLPEVLSRAARHWASGTRTIAVQYIHYLWKKGHRKTVIDILDELRDHMMIWRIPRLDILSSCAGISMLILFTEYRDQQALRQLQGYWQSILQTLLFIQPERRSLSGAILGAIRSRLIDFVTGVGISFFRSLEQAHDVVIFSISDIRHFFLSRDDLRENFGELIPYLDWRCTDIGSAESLLCELAETRDLMTFYLVLVVLGLHLVKDEQRTVEIMRKMLDLSLAASPPTVQALAPVIASSFYVGVRRKQSRGLVLDFFKQLMWNVNDRSRCLCKSNRLEHDLAPLGMLVSLDYFIHDAVDIDFVKRYIQRALQENDVTSLTGYIRSLTSEALSHRVPRPYVEVLKLFFDSDDARVMDAIVLALSRIRVYFPDEVDEFLEETGATMGLKRRIRISGIEENPGDLIAYHGIDFIVNAIMRDPESPIMPLFTWWFEQATKVRSLDQWIGLLVKTAINLIFGDCIFRTGQPGLDVYTSERATG